MRCDMWPCVPAPAQCPPAGITGDFTAVFSLSTQSAWHSIILKVPQTLVALHILRVRGALLRMRAPSQLKPTLSRTQPALKPYPARPRLSDSASSYLRGRIVLGVQGRPLCVCAPQSWEYCWEQPEDPHIFACGAHARTTRRATAPRTAVPKPRQHVSSPVSVLARCWQRW